MAINQANHPQREEVKDWHCKATGCPLWGSIDGLCRFHYGTEAGKWTNITTALRQNETLLKAINWARTDAQTMSHAAQNDYLKRIDAKYPTLAPQENETAKQWAYRADSFLTQAGSGKDHATEHAKLKMIAEKTGFHIKVGDFIKQEV